MNIFDKFGQFLVKCSTDLEEFVNQELIDAEVKKIRNECAEKINNHILEKQTEITEIRKKYVNKLQTAIQENKNHYDNVAKALKLQYENPPVDNVPENYNSTAWKTIAYFDFPIVFKNLSNVPVEQNVRFHCKEFTHNNGKTIRCLFRSYTRDTRTVNDSSEIQTMRSTKEYTLYLRPWVERTIDEEELAKCPGIEMVKRIPKSKETDDHK